MTHGAQPTAFIDPRIGPAEAAAIHAAAVTRDYSVHPRLGKYPCRPLFRVEGIA